jgi:alpha-galactosidase
MAKIAIIGAGGYVFPLRLVGDLLSFRRCAAPPWR